MRASAIEFRLRMVIMIIIVFVGFWAPWLGSFDFPRRISTLEWLPLEISRLGILSFSIATPTGEGVTTPLTFTRQRRSTSAAGAMRVL